MLFVTGNRNKVKEFSKILDMEIEQLDIDLPEYQGDAGYVVEEKAKLAFEKVKKPLIVEDTSLEFNALNGFPGPYIKDLVTKNDIGQIPLMLSAFDDKTAIGICSIAFIKEGKPIVFQGEVRGKIVQPRGESGFDWDPIFEPEGSRKTFAEMTADEKNAVSHRMKAIKKLKEYLINSIMNKDS